MRVALLLIIMQVFEVFACQRLQLIEVAKRVRQAFKSVLCYIQPPQLPQKGHFCGQSAYFIGANIEDFELGE